MEQGSENNADVNNGVTAEDFSELLAVLEEIRDDLSELRRVVCPYDSGDAVVYERLTGIEEKMTEDFGVIESGIEEIRIDSHYFTTGEVVISALLGVIAGLLIVLIFKRSK